MRDAMMTLYTPGLDTWVLDMVSLIESAQGTFPNPSSASPCGLTGQPGQCDDFVFNDFIHFTDAVNDLVAAEAASLVETGSPVAPIPLPAPLGFLAFGMASLVVVRRRGATA
jgi:hypothetical protein